MPWFYTEICALIDLGFLQAGCRIVLAAQFNPNVMRQIIEVESVARITAVPTMMLTFLKRQGIEPTMLVLCGAMLTLLVWFAGVIWGCFAITIDPATTEAESATGNGQLLGIFHRFW